MDYVSIVFSLLSLVFSIVTFIITVIYEKKKVTIEAINLLQNEVLDKLVSITEDNAILIVENLDNEECREAYNDYRALIARLEHFAIGVNKCVYDLCIVNDILGIHLIDLYNKVMPIIEEANKNESCTRHYCNFVYLVIKLGRRQKQNTRR